MRPNTIEERIRKNYNGLTKSCRRVGSFLLENMEEAAFYDLSDFGQRIGISEATVMRFVRGIGYEGFPKMQEDLRNWLREQITPLRKMEKSTFEASRPIYEAIIDNDTENLIKLKKDFSHEKMGKVVDKIIKSRCIYITGYRTSYPLAYLLYMFLTEIVRNVELVDIGGGAVYDRLIPLGKEDVLVAISFRRYSRATSEVAKFAKFRKCKIIGITDTPLSPLGEVADIALSVERSSPAFFNSYVACLCLLNCIVAGVSVKKGKDAVRNLKMGDDVLSELKVHLK